MKKYEYVEVHTQTFWGAECKEHRAIIEDYASRGYRYVGYIPTAATPHGVVTDMDLIFEIDA